MALSWLERGEEVVITASLVLHLQGRHAVDELIELLLRQVGEKGPNTPRKVDFDLL